MLKRKLIVVMVIVMILSAMPIAEAVRVGDVIGKVYHTDIVAYINNYAIPSYAANGTSVIVAEDLKNFCFDVVWNSNNRTLSITRNSSTMPVAMSVAKTGKPGSVFSNILYTDIKVYANGVQIPSYAINGYTMIPMEALTMLGECRWVSAERAIKLWVDGIHVRSEKQYVTPYSQNYLGVWRDPSYNANWEITVYEQKGDVISIFIYTTGRNGNRIATAVVKNVKIVNGKGTFWFEDSHCYRGTGTIVFTGDDKMDISYSNVQGNGLWSITTGAGDYIKTSIPIDYNRINFFI